MKYTILTILILFGLCSYAQQKNELNLMFDLTDVRNQSNYQLMYKHNFDAANSLRGGFSLFIDTDKEIRNDSLSSQSGTISYDLSLGVQRILKLEGTDVVHLFVGVDGYWNSTFNQKTYETYYGYYWNVGIKPLVGLYYDPLENIRLSIESRSRLNFNFQEYSAPGENKDQRVNFNPLNQLSIGIGYLF